MHHLLEQLAKAQPDLIQCDCQGHRGYASYPTKVGSPSPGIVKDALRIYRNVIVLPHQSKLGGKTVAKIKRFTQNGGGALAVGQLPAPLREVFGIQSAGAASGAFRFNTRYIRIFTSRRK